MLIQITNRCQEGCPHCLQDAQPDGPHMDLATFKAAYRFGLLLGQKIFVVSGGEPTEHPQFLEFCKELDNQLKFFGGTFTVTSNGMWFPDRVDEMLELAKLETFSGMQVYTNKKWYKDYDFIISHIKEINALPKVTVETTDIRSMQDLGRARTNADCQKEIAGSQYFMSCLNGHLLAAQVPDPAYMGRYMGVGTMCKPLVDYKGDVHLSESCKCPSFGNVVIDNHMEIFQNMKAAKPCLGCAGGRKFAQSTRSDIVNARRLLGI